MAGKEERDIEIIKGIFCGLGSGVVKWNQIFFTNTVLINDNVSCLEPVFSLLSLRTKTAKCCA